MSTLAPRFVFSILIAAAPCVNPAFSATTDWATLAEKTDYRSTPRYDETIEYLRRVAAAAPGQVKIEAFGKTGEGHILYQVVVSKDGQFTPAAARAHGPAVVLIQNGIHAGEIEGKDASLALLRDIVITKTRAELLDRAVLVFIPVYNIDGHERASRFNSFTKDINRRSTTARLAVVSGLSMTMISPWTSTSRGRLL